MSDLEATLLDNGIAVRELSVLVERDNETLFLLVMNGTRPEWRRLRDLVPVTGYWPVLGWDLETLEAYDEDVADLRFGSTADIIEAGLQISPDSWIANRVAHDPRLYTCPRGQWPEVVSVDEATRSLPESSISVALVPTNLSWQVPAYLRYGGWNNCPHPEVHVAMMRYWNDRYGAEVARMAADRVEVVVSHPPVDRVEAEQLAWEHFVYCPDLVHQETTTLLGLASRLFNAKHWGFWWD